MKIVFGLFIPFFGTILGSMMIFFLKGKMNEKKEKIIAGISAGIMLAAAIWSLIIPAMDSVEKCKWLPVTIGIVISIIFFYYLDKKIPDKEDYNLYAAMTIHNIPEGMAVGIIFTAYMMGSSFVTLPMCYALSIGVAIQNFPEGLITSLSILKNSKRKIVAFWYGFVSALFELLGSLLTIVFTRTITFLLPYFLSFAAGTMIYVVILELIPEANDEKNRGIFSFSIGFLLMMILDVVLG